MWNPFKKKKKIRVPYVPTGRLGYYKKDRNPWHYKVIFEEIGQINTRSKVKILEVDIDRRCNRSEYQVLSDYGWGNWVYRDNDDVFWESDEQKASRLGLPTTFEINEDEVFPNGNLNDKVQYRLTPHSML